MGKAFATGKVENDHIADWTIAWKLFPGAVAYVWHASSHSPLVGENLKCSGFDLRNLIIWAKNHLVIGRGNYHHQHEPCWYAVRKKAKAAFVGGRKQSTLWQIPKPQKNDTGHSTQKPLECMARPIRNHASEFVYEPFSGSGTTIIACEQLGRKCRAIEISPGYVAVAIQRWADMTGKTPRLL
jgi:DNA modification methylase